MFLILLQVSAVRNPKNVILNLVFAPYPDISVKSSEIGLVPGDFHRPSLTIDVSLSEVVICITNDIGQKYNFKEAPCHIINDYFCIFNQLQMCNSYDIQYRYIYYRKTDNTITYFNSPALSIHFHNYKRYLSFTANNITSIL